MSTFTDNCIHHFNNFYALDTESAHITTTTGESDLESTNLVESNDNAQSMEFQVQLKLFFRYTIIIDRKMIAV